MTLPTNHNFFSMLLLVLILYSSSFASASEPKAEHEYTYTTGTSKGPQNWSLINPNWTVCGDGKLQSPIDLLDQTLKELPQLGELENDYKPAPAVLKNRGHDILLQWNGDAGQIHINGTYYKLKHAHWHSPSEHTLNGMKFDLELHAVHQTPEGGIAVIGILYKIGLPDPFLSKLFEAIKSIRDKDIGLGVMNLGEIEFGSRKYYRYVGSLTTPPCTEGVVWTIVKKVGTVSREQLSALKGAVDQGFQENARPTQQLNGREVWLYNPAEDEKPIFKYLYEDVKGNCTIYPSTLCKTKKR